MRRKKGGVAKGTAMRGKSNCILKKGYRFVKGGRIVRAKCCSRKRKA